MSRNRTLALAGALVFCLALVTAAPARLLSFALGPVGASVQGLEGTVWSGQARTLAVLGLRLEQVQWQLRPARLLRGELAADVEATLPGGFLRGQLFRQLGGASGARNLEGGAPLRWLAPGSAAMTGGDTQLSVRLDALELKDGWIRTAVGSLDLGQVTLPIPTLRGKVGPGSYGVSFTARDQPPEQPVIGAIRDLGGPLEVSGELQLRPPREYVLNGTLKPRPDTPAELTSALRTVGPRTPDGGYGFSLAGSF